MALIFDAVHGALPAVIAATVAVVVFSAIWLVPPWIGRGPDASTRK